jgi:hypothetical protein
MRGLGADTDFAAAFAEGEDFAGIEGGIGIEGVVDAAHEIEVGVGEEERHELGFFHADAVLAGERAADFDAIADDFGGGFEGALELRGVAGIVEHDGVQVAVAGVENVSDLKAILIADLLDAAQSLRKFRTRNDAVEDVIAGGQAAECAESVFAAFPEEVAFGVIAGDADFSGVMGIADFGDVDGLRGDGFGEAFDFNEENGGAVHGKTGVDVIFDGAESPAIEHFAGGGSDGAGGDVGDRFGGIIDGIEYGEKCFHGFGLARKLYGDFGDQGERAFRADEEAGEIVTGRVAVFASDANDFAIGEDEFEGGDMIGGDAVGEGVRAAGVFGDVAADGAGFPTGRIGGEVETVRFGGAGELVIDDARLDDGALIFDVEFENAIHAREDEHHAAGAGERAAGKSRAGAAANDGEMVLCGEFDDARDMIRCCWKNDDVGTAFFNGAVVLEKKKILGPVKNGRRAEKFLEFANEARVHRARDWAHLAL